MSLLGLLCLVNPPTARQHKCYKHEVSMTKISGVKLCIPEVVNEKDGYEVEYTDSDGRNYWHVDVGDVKKTGRRRYS